MKDKALKMLYKKKLTLFEYSQIEDIVNGFYCTTISQKVADFFKRNKAEVKEEGIGWRIKL